MLPRIPGSGRRSENSACRLLPEAVIPALIQQIPDYVIESLPKFREQLEATAEAHFTDYCQTTAEALASHLDVFLEENKESINAFLEAAQDADAADELGAKLEDELRLYLQDPGEDGESIQDKLNEFCSVCNFDVLRNFLTCSQVADGNLRPYRCAVERTVGRRLVQFGEEDAIHARLSEAFYLVV